MKRPNNTSKSRQRRLLTERLEDRHLLAGPYAPAAGQLGSTAIAKDDGSIVGWASDFSEYAAGSNVDAEFQTPGEALGPAEGTIDDVVSLGRHGRITLTFAQPIWDGIGPDFAVFGNAFNDTFLELGFVEVSSDGINFFRFENDSRTSASAGAFSEIDPTNINNLAGKYRRGFGTPFDLEELSGVSPLLNPASVTHVRVIDIVGDGSQTDSSGDPIYDPFPTVGSAGFDLDAVAVMHQAGGSLEVVGFEDLGATLAAESAFSGPVAGGTTITGPFGDNVVVGDFQSETLSFNNAYSVDQFGSWNGFSYSNVTDTTTAGFTNQFAAFAGSGAEGSATFGVGFPSQGGFFELPTIRRDPNDERLFSSLMVTNTTYAALSMRNGDAFARRFGGASGDLPDYLKLTITGVDAASQEIGDVEFYLADYRFADNSLDYIVDQWMQVDLTPLANARSLEFSIESTDVGPFGINTPAYFAIDNITLAKQTLLVDIADREVAESAGANATRIRVSRPDNDTSVPIEVTVSASDAGAITVPSLVTIPVGARSVEFSVGVVGNQVFEGDRQVDIDLAAAGYAATGLTVTIQDDDPRRLTLTLNQSSILEGSSLAGVVTRNDVNVSQPLTVQLSSSVPELAFTSDTIRIEAGQSSGTFVVTAAEDDVDRPNFFASVSASAAGYLDGTLSVVVTDNDQPSISLELDSTTYAESDAKPTAGFEDVGRTLLTDSFYNGSDQAGDFVSAGLTFNNEFDPTFGSWAGWAYSNASDTTTAGFSNQYSSITGIGAAQSDTYAVATAYNGALIPSIRRDPATTGSFQSIDITNTTYAALSMMQGDAFAKQFGGESGDDPDFFQLTIEGFDADESSVGTIDFFLADYRFADNGRDYIVDHWTTVDVSALTHATELRFGLSSSDVGAFGMNTPAYFAVDNVVTESPTESPMVTVQINGVVEGEPLEVSLLSNDTSELVVPPSVRIPVGQQAVAFPLQIVDDALFDGAQVVTLRASAAGHGSTEIPVTITDDEFTALTLTISPLELSEANGEARAVVHRNVENVQEALLVELSASTPDQVILPTAVTIPAGQRSAEFTVRGDDNSTVDGNRSVAITVSAEGFTDGLADVLIIENDTTPPTLSIEFDSSTLNEAEAPPTAMFEEIGAGLLHESFDNGANLAGGFDSGPVHLNNTFDPTFGSWGGWSVSNMTDTETAGFLNQYSAVVGSGAHDSATYAVASAFPGGTAPTISMQAPKQAQGFESLMVTNTTYAALSMANGDAFAKKFGGPTGDDPDFFLLTIEGLNAGGQSVGSVEFYLADFRFPEPDQDYIVDQWTAVDVSSLVGAAQLEFSLSSSDNGAFGMNTPAYFAVDQIMLADDGAVVTATVTRSGDDLSDPLLVDLGNDDASELQVPASVMIPVGAAAVTFPIRAVDDAVVDGPVSVTVTAAAHAHTSAAASVTVMDDDQPALTITAREGDVDESSSTQLIVHRNTQDLSSELVVEVEADNGGSVQATVTIPEGMAATVIDVGALDNAVRDGDRAVTVTATAVGFETASVSLTVRDDEISALIVNESAGTTAVTELLGEDDFEVSLASRPLTDVFVDISLHSDDVALSVTRLAFQPDQWDTPQRVVVYGLADWLIEDQESFTVTLSVNNEQSDALFAAAPDSTVDLVVDDYQVSRLRFSENDEGVFVIDEQSGRQLTGASHDQGVAVVANDLPQQIHLESLVRTRGPVQIDAAGGDDLVVVEGTRFSSIVGGQGYDQLLLNVDAAVNLVDFLDARVAGFEEIILATDSLAELAIDLSRIDSITPQDGTLLIRVGRAQDVQFQGSGLFTQPAMVGTEFAQVIRSGVHRVHVINQRPWQNALNRWDVNQSGSVSARDALVIVNRLAQVANANLPSLNSLEEFLGLYVDVSGDGRITALDALLVINELSRLFAAGEGETIPLSGIADASEREHTGSNIAGPMPAIAGSEPKLASFTAWQDEAIRQLYLTDVEPSATTESADGLATSLTEL